MQAAQIMTCPVVTVGPDTTLGDAVRLMLDRRISGLPVVDSHGHLLGILSEGDLLRRAETGTDVKRARWLEFLTGPGRLAEEYVHTHGRRVAEVMTPHAVTASETTSLEDIVQLMQSRRIKRVPILRDGAVIGLVSRADLIRALAQRLHGPGEAAQSDQEISKRVTSAMQRTSWGGHHGVTARVENGVVHLDGTIFDERERGAFKVLVENVAGVRDVEDHMVWVEPNSGMVISGG